MSEEEIKVHLNSYSYLIPAAEIQDSVVIPLPPGTKAPPRPRPVLEFDDGPVVLDPAPPWEAPVPAREAPEPKVAAEKPASHGPPDDPPVMSQATPHVRPEFCGSVVSGPSQ